MRLPLELFDIVIDHVTETPDLLSFGLTCKYLAGLIFRYHLLYHTISAPIRRTQLWTYLALNPKICRYIRRLEVIDFHNPKMRLSNIELEKFSGLHQIPDNLSPMLWSYEVFVRALRKMVNLKVFKWLHNETPILYAESSITKDFPNLNFQGRMPGSPFSFRDMPSGGRYASIFDTPVINRVCDLVTVIINSSRDPLDCGKSISNFLRACNSLEYLNLFVNHQSLAKDLIISCRWPNLRVLSLSISYDRSKDLTEETVTEFFEYHWKIVSLKWRVAIKHFIMPSFSFPPGLFPSLKALEGDKDLVRSIIVTPCVPPRPLKKILNFPTDSELWKEPETTFQGIDRFKLQIVSFMVRSLSQLTDFGRFFTNVDCIDISESSICTGIWDSDMKHFRTPLIVECAEKLSCFRNLRVILGIQFLGDASDEEENDRRLGWILELFPHLEFCADRFSLVEGVNLIRDGNSIHWESAATPSWCRFLGRDADFMIPEEYDRDIV